MARDKTADNFSQFLQAFSSNEAEAVSAYTNLYNALVRFFHLKGESLPEEAADITVDRVCLKISQNERIEDVTKYCFGVARLVFLERLRQFEKEKIAATTFYSQKNTNQPVSETDPLEIFRDCINSLNNQEKSLLKEYFADKQFSELKLHRENLSKSLGISLNKLRLNIFRLRERLENCVNKKLREK